MELKNVTLPRTPSDEHQTLGTISFTKDDGTKWSGFTMELAWKENQHDISCIPPGTYRCSYTRSNRLSQVAGHDVFTYEVLNVPDRAGIRIHSANFFSQLLGCIALGNAAIDINNDGELDVANSRDTVADFVAQLNKQDFLLIIKGADTIS